MALKTRYTNVGGQVAAVKTGGQRYFVEPDALGNVRGLVNQSGVRSQTYTYWPYGEVRTSTGSVSQPLQFCGTWGYYTESSTKQYVRARYYMQSIGRWQTVDPLWPREMAYGYVAGRVTMAIDSNGNKLTILGCGDTVTGAFKKVCARIKELTPPQDASIHSCIQRTARVLGRTCQPFNAHRRKCYQAFCDHGYVECQPMNGKDYNGWCPSYSAPTDTPVDPTGGIIVKFPLDNSTFVQDINGIGGRLVFLHEVGHACGVDHASGGDACTQCNDIYACCMLEALMGRTGQRCIDDMKKYKNQHQNCGTRKRGRL